MYLDKYSTFITIKPRQILDNTYVKCYNTIEQLNNCSNIQIRRMNALRVEMDKR